MTRDTFLLAFVLAAAVLAGWVTLHTQSAHRRFAEAGSTSPSRSCWARSWRRQ